MKFFKTRFLIIFLLMSFTSIKKSNIIIKETKTNKGYYLHNEAVSFEFTAQNTGNTKDFIRNISITVKNISEPNASQEFIIPAAQIVNIKPQSEKKIKVDLFKAIPLNFKNDAYGVYLSYENKMGEIKDHYVTFFRVIDKDEITVFNIETEHQPNAKVFKLDGGMSAEYVIEKSAENLTAGISHSWKVNAPGSGPNHVLGTPDYLKKSLNKTINFYNKTLGEDTLIETVIISPGIPSVPYISNALKAPVLPLHFLVSVNTVKEIQTILKEANNDGIIPYATLSHDPSVPYAVSWIKLLELPKIYTDFIKKHKVKNVVILGATGTSGGETKAKQLLYDKSIKGEYATKSIYIMYPGTSPDDVKTLNAKIVDLKEFKQQNHFTRIVDWESGINQKQLINFSKDVKAINGAITVTTITAHDLGRLYYLGTYSTLALMHKNKEKFNGVKGVILNPYLIAHPVIELKKGFVPLLYWQLVGSEYTVYNLEHDVFKAIKYFYPDTDVKKIKLWLNSTRNFGGSWSANGLKSELVKKGYTHFIENNYQLDEVWDLSDGLESPNELLYKEVNNTYGFKSLKKWKDSLQPLTIEDIKNLSKIFGGFKLKTK